MRSAIITLTWQDCDDTTEYLESLCGQLGDDDCFYLLDNASKAEYADKIEQWLEAKVSGQYRIMTLDDFVDNYTYNQAYRYIFIRSPENMGFAVANNVIFDVIKDAGFKYITLINNDTLLSPDTLSQLFSAMEKYPEYGVMTGDIRYYSEREKLWNAGGYFTFYGDKRYFNQKKIDKMKARGREVMDCEFLTGCFMCCRTELLLKYGLFTDKFFFGEDDFNFCMRMKKAGIKLGCALNAVLYHKVSSSMVKTSANDDYRNIVHFTNRIIDQKEFMTPIKWRCFRRIYLGIVMLKMLKNRYGFKTSKRVTGAVAFYSKKYNTVDRAVFMDICERYKQ